LIRNDICTAARTLYKSLCRRFFLFPSLRRRKSAAFFFENKGGVWIYITFFLRGEFGWVAVPMLSILLLSFLTAVCRRSREPVAGARRGGPRLRGRRVGGSSLAGPRQPPVSHQDQFATDVTSRRSVVSSVVARPLV